MISTDSSNKYMDLDETIDRYSIKGILCGGKKNASVKQMVASLSEHNATMEMVDSMDKELDDELTSPERGSFSPLMVLVVGWFLYVSIGHHGHFTKVFGLDILSDNSHVGREIHNGIAGLPSLSDGTMYTLTVIALVVTIVMICGEMYQLWSMLRNLRRQRALGIYKRMLLDKEAKERDLGE